MSQTARENVGPSTRLAGDARVVLIRFSSLGDCLLLCPVPRLLKEMGAAEVVVITKRAYADVFANADGVDRVVAFAGGGLRALVQIASEFRGRGYTVVDAHNTLRSRLLSAGLGGADVRLDKHYAERLGLIVFKRRTRLPTILGQYAGLVAALAGSPQELTPGGFVIPPRARETAARWLPDNDYVVALAPGSRWPSKRWGTDHFVALAHELVKKRDARILLAGDDGDRNTCAEIAGAVGERCLDISGRASLCETAACIARSSLLVANDSGLMHLAEAVGVPVVGVFGPTVREFGYYPSLPASRTVERRLACRPCSRNGAVPCLRGTVECLAEIPHEAVRAAIDSVTDGGETRHHILD